MLVNRNLQKFLGDYRRIGVCVANGSRLQIHQIRLPRFKSRTRHHDRFQALYILSTMDAPFDKRVALVRAMMDEKRIEILVLRRNSNLAWLIGGRVHVRLTIDTACFEQVIARSDVISIHLPNNLQTRHLINAQSMSQMKPGVFLINVGRGEAVNENALKTGSRSGALGGVALDVRSKELPKLGDLEKLLNAILMPHIAGATKEIQSAIAEGLAEDIKRALTGKRLMAAVGSVKMYSV